MRLCVEGWLYLAGSNFDVVRFCLAVYRHHPQPQTAMDMISRDIFGKRANIPYFNFDIFIADATGSSQGNRNETIVPC